MSKTSAKANPKNQDTGDHNQGSEPGQEQQTQRLDRQATGNAGGSNRQATNQGAQPGQGQNRDKKAEKGDARRSSKK